MKPFRAVRCLAATLGAGLLLAWAACAVAAIGTPTTIGSAGGSSGTTLAITTNADAAAGDLNGVVTLGDQGHPSSATDSASNTYTLGTLVTSSTAQIGPLYSATGNHLANGGTQTVTYTGAVDFDISLAFTVSGISSATPLDNQGAGTTSTGTAPSVTEGTVSNSNRIVFGYCYVSLGSSDSFTEASGFTTLGSVSSGGSILRMAYKIVSTGTQVTYAPTLGTSRTFVANTISFQASSAAATVHTLMMMGMGHASNDNHPSPANDNPALRTELAAFVR